MTLADAAPVAGLVAALGVALLLVRSELLARVAGSALLGLGALPVALHGEPRLADLVTERPALAAAAAVVGAIALLGLGVLASRRLWLLPAAALAVGWLRLPVGGAADAPKLLLPLYAVIAVGLAALLVAARRGEAGPQRLGRLGWALAAYVALAAASLFWTEDLDGGAVDLVAFYLPFGALAAIVGVTGLHPRLVPALAVGHLVLATAFAALAFWQWRSEELLWNRKVEVANIFNSFFRVNSAFFDPSMFGRFQVLALLTLVGLLALARPRPLLLAASALAVPIFGALYLTYSQSSHVALGAGLTTLAAAVWRGRAAVAIGGLATVAVIGGLALPTTRDALDENLDRVTSGRAGLVERGLDLWRDHPVAGVGLGGFGEATGRTPGQQARLASHTAPVSTAAELGTLGVLALTGVVIAAALAVRRPAVPGLRAVRLLVAVELVAIVVHSLFYNALFEDPYAWVLVALVVVLSQVDGRSGRRRAA